MVLASDRPLVISALGSATFREGTGMRRSAWIGLLVLADALACGRPERSASPLAALDGVTRAEVSVWPPSSAIPKYFSVRDSEMLAQLRELATASGDWAPMEYASEPNGDLRAALYRDTAYLGVVSIGDGWVGARGPEGGSTLYRRMSPIERPLRAALHAAAQ